MTILAVFFGEEIYNLGNCIADTEHCKHASTHEYSDEPEWWYWARRLVAAEDTLAQWIMAFFTIFATGVLILTLRSANNTNVAAVKAATAALEANRIMRSEKRPWVTLKWEPTCDCHDMGSRFKIMWNYNFENKGLSPARDIFLRCDAVKGVNDLSLPDLVRNFADQVATETSISARPILFPGEATNFVRHRGGWYSYTKDMKNVEFAEPILLVCLCYRFGLQNEEVGIEATAFAFDENTPWLGPLSMRMVEYSFAKYIR